MSIATASMASTLLRRKALVEPLQRLPAATIGNLQHPTNVQVVDHRHVLVPALKRRLVHPETRHRLSLAARQPAPYRPTLDAVERVPAHSQPPAIPPTGWPRQASQSQGIRTAP